MRPTLVRTPALVVALLSLAALPAPAPAADVDLNGNWRLSLLSQLMENDLLVVKMTDHGGKLDAEVADSQPLPAPPRVSGVSSKGGTLSLAFKINNIDAEFSGKLAGGKSVTGVLKVADQVIPATLEKTATAKVTPAPQQPPELLRDYFEARKEATAKARVKKLREVIARKPGNPSISQVYADVARDAEAAELPAAEVRKIVSEWVDGAKPYGDAYAAGVRVQAVTALAGKKAYAPIALELAQQAESTLPADAPVSTRAEVARALASSAKLAGNDSVAASAQAKSNLLEAQLDEEYHQKVPPFKPEPAADGKDRKGGRVVLLELFTGAECPPCVAADVAFDALIQSYKPSALVTLQYHLHIPGPDPLTNADSELRAEYYPDLRGTPSPFFDGKSLAGGGGGMANAKAKYEQYRAVVDDELSTPARASIDLKVDREGQTLKIRASAEAKSEGTKLRLRLALVEEEIRYVGGNSLRFHHHVVRAMPGGVNGVALSGGKGKAEVKVDLADVRKILESYLSDFQSKGASFRRATPSIPLAKLSVVAFVQDDDDKSVLNAALVPAGDAK